AADENEPLLERVKFCGIVSSVLDEFFMVRVAGLLDQVVSGIAVRSPDGRAPQQTLEEIRVRALQITAEQSHLWRHRLVPAPLPPRAPAGRPAAPPPPPPLAAPASLSRRQISPLLTPLAVGPGQPFPYIAGLSLSLGLIVRDPESGEERFARVKVPEVLDRF